MLQRHHQQHGYGGHGRDEQFRPKHTHDFYSKLGERLEVALRFVADNQSVTKGEAFELFPAQPNPFNEKTLIRFYLPEATEATLSIFDETGRALFVWKAGFAKGLHELPVLRRMLDGSPAAGLLFYKVETASDSAVRSMMIAD